MNRCEPFVFHIPAELRGNAEVSQRKTLVIQIPAELSFPKAWKVGALVSLRDSDTGEWGKYGRITAIEDRDVIVEPLDNVAELERLYKL